MRRKHLAALTALLALAGCDPRQDPSEAGAAYGEGLKGKGAARKCVLHSFDAYEDPHSRWLYGEACQDVVTR